MTHNPPDPLASTDRFGGHYIAHRGRTGLSIICMECSEIVYQHDGIWPLAPESLEVRDGIAAIEAHRCDGAMVQ